MSKFKKVAEEYKCYIATNPAPSTEPYTFREYGTNRKVTIVTSNINEQISISMFMRSQKKYEDVYYNPVFNGHDFIGISGDKVLETDDEIKIITNNVEKCTLVVEHVE